MTLKRIALLLLLAAPLAAHSQGLTPLAPGATGGGKVLASFPLSTSGPLITEDANTVAHVYWNGTALVDSKGNAWTENGTVPQVTANPFTVERFGSGPFSAANYYSLGTGDDVLDFAGDMTVCVVFSGLLAGTSEVASDGGFGAAGAGWTLLASATQVIFDTYDAASAYTRASAAAVVTSGPHVICGGRSGSTQYVKGNLVATVSQAGAKTVAATSNPAMIGRRATGAGTAPMEGTIYEVYATTTPFTEATVLAIQQKVLGHFDGTSALAVTRATTATYAPRAADPSTLFTVPAGVARITDEGLLVEPARTNSALASNTISAANAFNVNWVAWPDETRVDVTTTATAAPGGGTWHTITNEAGTTSNVGQAYQTVTTASSTTFVASAWMKKPTGEDTTHAGIHVGCGAGTPTACTCVRSDGGSCTASTVATNYCQALVADLSTTPVRVSAKVTCSGAITSSIVALVPGNYGSTIGITDFSAVMHEIGTYPTSHVVTTTTAMARNADAVTATVPAVPTKWCVAVTAAPGSGTAWTIYPNLSYLWTLGVLSTANSVGIGFLASSRTFLDHYSASPTAEKYIASGATPSAGAHRFIGCSTSGVLSLKVDANAYSTASGTGTGLFTTAPTTLSFSPLFSTTQIASLLKNVRVCNAPNGAKDCP